MTSADTNDRLASDLDAIRTAQQRGPLATLATYMRLSGPGWLQSAITLGGGSLASSLYLGVLAGFSMLWLQPLAMVLGIVMLSAIAYVTLSTGERPFQAINRHVNPVLGWGWALASLAANMVWSLPQFALATSVVQQNLAPGLFGNDGPLGETGSKLLIVALILALTVAVTFAYDRGTRGVQIYERLLKGLVALVVLCFFGVVVRLSTSVDGLDWGAVLAGFVPDFGSMSEPTATFGPFLDAVSAEARAFWTTRIVAEQRDVMISAAATAVGINMTFLLPYSILKRGWNREFRGLARVDLAVGMLVPFLLATSCVVIAAASRFHTKPVEGLVTPAATAEAEPAPKLRAEFEKICDARIAALDAAAADASDEQKVALRASLPEADRTLAAMLVKRDAFDLAKALAPFTGDFFANILFGIGVLGMALSTITLLMLISGFVICEMLGLPPGGRAHRLGTLAATTGALGPFVWSKAAFYLAVPTSVFGMALLPIAYWTFFLMMNSRSLLGDDMPRGRSRIIWNTLMLLAAGAATGASIYSIEAKAGTTGMLGLGAFLALAAIAHFRRRR
ncbi:MAG: divalent metal cation transporter [Planctomycetota bacterium]|nr:divalent metal cation transporter [Planctomycetota bacterium]MDA0932328.1 divalent metal cation transporter [Planctomycetota bacterium]MDA1221849.1 divalent metal cation transporter [Planctomycetota bacterium]